MRLEWVDFHEQISLLHSHEMKMKIEKRHSTSFQRGVGGNEVFTFSSSPSLSPAGGAAAAG